MVLDSQYEYAGFWVRVGSTLIDSIIFLVLSMPLLYWIYGNYYFESERFILGGWDLLLNWVFPFIATVLFWVCRSATPGKMAFKLKVVDDKTGKVLSTSKSIIRYLAYYVSAIPLGLGFIWIAFNGKKRGWHDMIAHTVVIRPKDRRVEAVEFEKRT